MRRLGFFALGMLLGLNPAWAQDAIDPGLPESPHPTLEHVSIVWPFTGDENENSVVSVRYRKAGGSFRQALPLVRVPAGENEGRSWIQSHAGSLFGLEPDTEYEVELSLVDPDDGGTTVTLSVRTRAVPSAAAEAVVKNVGPESAQDALSGLRPGDVLLLAAGTYGALQLSTDGEPGRPIVVRGVNAAEVVVEGDVRMDGRSHLIVESLTVEGQIKFNDASNLAVIGCEVRAGLGASGDGIVAYGSGSRDGYFADNIVTGRTTFEEASLGAEGDNVGEGIVMTGPGNVIVHNRVSGFRDCISLLEDEAALEQYSIDIVRNDLSGCADDAVEADFAMGNVRVLENRVTNTFIAFSSQPSLGGPTYFVRNVSFNNIFQVFKPNRGSVGDYFLHNTVVKSGDALGVYSGVPWSRAVFRNNLLIGGAGGREFNGWSSGDGAVISVADADDSCSFDYDGLGSHDTGTFVGRIGATRFSSFEELVQSGQEAHATRVTLDVFAEAVPFPSDPLQSVETPDLRLGEGAAVDRGVVLANLNDGFRGDGPDLGAYELGTLPPLYGPRGEAVCGNGARERGEECDDGNDRAGDGCEACQASEPEGGGGGSAGVPGAPAEGGSGPAAGGSVSGSGGVRGGGSAGADAGNVPAVGCSCDFTNPSHTARLPILLALVASRLVRRKRRSSD